MSTVRDFLHSDKGKFLAGVILLFLLNVGIPYLSKTHDMFALFSGSVLLLALIIFLLISGLVILYELVYPSDILQTRKICCVLCEKMIRFQNDMLQLERVGVVHKRCGHAKIAKEMCKPMHSSTGDAGFVLEDADAACQRSYELGLVHGKDEGNSEKEREHFHFKSLAFKFIILTTSLIGVGFLTGILR